MTFIPLGRETNWFLNSCIRAAARDSRVLRGSLLNHLIQIDRQKYLQNFPVVAQLETMQQNIVKQY